MSTVSYQSQIPSIQRWQQAGQVGQLEFTYTWFTYTFAVLVAVGKNQADVPSALGKCSESVYLEWGPRLCISNELPDDAGPGITLWVTRI